MKRIIALFLSVTVLPFLLSACRPDQEKSTEPGTSSQKTPSIVSEIASKVSPPVYEDSSSQSSQSSQSSSSSSESSSQESSEDTSSLFTPGG